MKILVLGALGMMGKYLIHDLVSSGHDVVASDYQEIGSNILHSWKERIPYFKIDITKPETFRALDEQHFDSVVLLAGLMPATMSGYHPEKYFEVNTLGTLNVLNFCKEKNIPQIIFMLSHSDMAGYWGQKDAISPYAPPAFVYGNDHSVYSVSKRAAVELIKHFHAECNLKYAVFRCPNIYAWQQDDYFYVNGIKKEIGWRKIVKKACASEDVEIWGDCKIKKDIVYIKDLTWMIRTSIEKQIESSIYNVGTGQASSLEEQILAIIQTFSPKNNPSKIIYRPDINVKLNNHHYDIENVIQELGYKPQYPLQKMFDDMKKEKEELEQA